MIRLPHRRWLRWVVITGAVLTLVVLGAFVTSREVRYVARAGYEEARILLARRPLAELLADTAVSAERRAAFRLVLDARAFAADELGLDAGGTYTSFVDVGRDTLVLLLSASPSDRLVPHTWRYPVVGAVPYKGFFDAQAARAEAARLESRGLDTYLRPAGAFSTLGWFDDPLLSTAMSDDPVQLVATVIHEIAHNTLYVPGETRFNESFASFVGYRGAEAFFTARGDSAAAARAGAIWRDELRLGVVMRGMYDQLEQLYGEGRPPGVLALERKALLTFMRLQLRGPVGARLEVYDGAGLAAREFNNASLIAWTLYRWRLGTFENVLERVSGGVAAAVKTIVEQVRNRPDAVDPYGAIQP